jgi:hypothetical protein
LGQLDSTLCIQELGKKYSHLHWHKHCLHKNKNIMKNKILIAAAAAAGAALVTYLIRRAGTNSYSQTPQSIPAKRSHHLTNVFAHAKNHSDSTQFMNGAD